MTNNVVELQNEIMRINKMIQEIQNNCEHVNSEFKYGADTGNYSKSDDLYWKDYFCQKCKKSWRVYS
jgi:FPC/CPF motif-containing protein YcgG